MLQHDSALIAALYWRDRDVFPVPVPHKSKAPMINDWPNLRLDEQGIYDAFTGGYENLGILLGEASGGLVDVDLDSANAVKVAPYFFPDTLKFGRASKPRSHYLYYCEGYPTKKYQHNEMILELRSTGAQTVFPPSMHPDKEVIYYDESSIDEPQSIIPLTLTKAAQMTATAALLCSEWNNFKGIRHELTLHLVGALLHAQWGEQQVQKFFTAIIENNDDIEQKDRAKAVSDTIKKFNQGKPVGGIPKLIECLGSQLGEKIIDWLNISPNDFVDTLIERKKNEGKQKEESAKGTRINLVKGDEVERKELIWLWKNKLPAGKLTILAGDPSLGKSLITIDIAARVTTGAAFPLESETRPPAKVIFLAAEDTYDDTVLPRLDAAHAAAENIFLIPNVIEPTNEGEMKRAFSFTRHIHLLDDLIQREPQIKLLVIDPLKAYSDGIDSHKNAEVREYLMPLNEVCSRHGVAILGVDHLSKSRDSKAMYRISGSLAYIASARFGYVITKDKDDPDRRIMAGVKANLAPEQMGLAYKIVEKNKQPVIQWEDGPVLVDVDEQLEHEDGDSRTQRQDAMQWLQETLADGQIPAKEIFKLANIDGHSERTLKRAKAALKIKSIRDNNQWYWVLDASGPLSLVSDIGPLGTVKEIQQESKVSDNSSVPSVPESDTREQGTVTVKV